MDKKWVINFFNTKIEELTLYIPDEDGKFIAKHSGVIYNFSQREYPHRNNIFDFDLKKANQVYYARIKISSADHFGFSIYSTRSLLAISLKEYAILALLLGVILALVLYNLFFYIILKHTEYLFYVLYGLSVALFAVTEDGIGFQFLWPSFPEWTIYIFGISLCSISVWMLFYTKAFFEIKRKMLLLQYLFIGLVIMRIAYLLLAIMFFPDLLKYRWPEVFPFLFTIAISIIYIGKENRLGIYLMIAQLLMLILTAIDFYDLLPYGPIGSFLNLFGFNLGVMLQMILLSFAMAQRIKELEKTKKLIELRDKELDNFVYKVSHDLKGPLKSIIGLTTVGQQDPKLAEAKNYFDMILKNTKRLDGILADLVLITKVKQASAKKERIDFEQLINEILSSLQYYPSFHEMDFKVQIHGVSEVYSDRGLLYSVFQNIIENAIKYKKPSNSPLFEGHKEKSYLHIDVLKGPHTTTIIFADNGLGIPKEYQERIFEMFFRLESDISGTGLGLYLVKMSIEKLGGKISVDGKAGEGTTFTLELDNE